MNDIRLVRQFRPTHYTLRVSMERHERRFSGTVIIDGESSHGTVQLHAHALHVVRASIDGSEVAHSYGNHDTLTLGDGTLRPGKHQLRLDFEGTITDPMHGLYPCYFKLDGQDHELLATQFESHHAREVFPCIDEPEAKATFDLTLETEVGVTTISNMPIAQQTQQNDRLITSFETTPIMSTYLLAWVVGKLDYQEAVSPSGVTIRAYATPDKRSQLSFALQTAVDCLEFFNDYYGVPYPLPKCDLVALPDFSAGAMENWGCITFREAYMLVDETTSTHIKQWAVMVVAHEMAHQWFGDLVTMRWWNDLWLNESFANWMEYMATDRLYPEWDVWTQYYQDETAYAFKRDALASVQTIQQEVRTPEEIAQLFDSAIVYAKGGSLLNMLHAYLGAEAFRAGIRTYLQRHQYNNTDASDLWDAWADASGHDVRHFMEPWISQPGLPLVTVGLSGGTLNLHQRRFFANPKQAQGNQQAAWPIPLLASQPLPAELLTQSGASLTLDSSDSAPLLLNAGRKGYYMTLYDPQHLQQLTDLVRSGAMDPIDRLGLLNDSLELSRAGMQSHVTALHLLEAYGAESSQPVWSAIGAHIDVLKMFAGDDEAMHTSLKRFVHNLAARQYSRLGWQKQATEPHADTLLRPQIIAHMLYAGDTKTLAQAQQLFADAALPGDINGDVRAVVCAAVGEHGSQADFQKMLNWYTAPATSAEQRTHVAAGLCASRSTSALSSILPLLTNGTVRLQDLAYWVKYLAGNRFARNLAWQWMQDNWQWIVTNFGNDLGYTAFPKFVAGAFSTPEQLASYKAFFEPIAHSPGLGRSLLQNIDDIEGRVAWRQRDEAAVAEYLRSLE